LKYVRENQQSLAETAEAAVGQGSAPSR
jgi:hypothetical protein